MGVLALPSGCDDDANPQREPIPADDSDDDDTGGDETDETDAGPGPTAGGTTNVGSTGGSTDTDPSDTDPTGNAPTSSDPTDPDPTTGTPPANCQSQGGNITESGFVTSSSVFDPWFGAPYDAVLAIDGSTSTSWFSAGPEDNGLPSTFEWYTQSDHCLDGLTLVGNADHEEPDFREGFGFESVVVEVFDSAGAVVYSQTHSLEGTPDPQLTINLEGRPANRIVLELSGHESPDCGGFSEFTIEGRATQ